MMNKMNCNFKQSKTIDITNDKKQPMNYSAKIPDIIFRDSMGRKLEISFDFMITETKVKDERFEKGFHNQELMIIAVKELYVENMEDDYIFETEFSLDEEHGGVYPK